jgi:hypothetical protein
MKVRCRIVLPALTNVSHVIQDFLQSRSLALSGKKAELAERVAEWLDEHP